MMVCFGFLSAIENGEDGAMEYLTKYYKQNRRGEWVKNCFHSILRDTLCLLKIIKGGLCSIEISYDMEGWVYRKE